MNNIGIIGATGYVGSEIVRILSMHPDFNITTLVSHSFVGKKYSEVYSSLRGIVDIECDPLDLDLICSKADIFITALPHGISKDVIPELIKRGKRVIDHSGDFRYDNIAVYEKWYNIKHAMPELLDMSIYGMPELYRKKIKSAKLVGNPGCYPTCSILAIAPLLKNNLVKTDNIIIDSASGVSGAGRKNSLGFMFCEADENYKAYKVATHRHTSEIEQELSKLANKDILISFTPHLLPMKRGMLSTSYLNFKDDINLSLEQLVNIYNEFYKNDFFVRILEPGVLPETKNVAGSNFIDIGIVKDERLNRAVVVSTVDNLGKGAASQAIQCLNIMCGIDETRGLKTPSLYL